MELGPPVPKPSKIIAVGLNYRDHAGEANFKVPEYPLIFAKFPNSIAGPHDAIVIPAEDMQVDSEAELAVVIGRRGKAIRAEAAYDYVAGYMALERCVGAEVAIRGQAVDARKIVRHVLSDGAVVDDAGRDCGSA